MNFYAAIHAKEYYKVVWYFFLLWYWNFCRILIFLSALWVSKPAANWYITTSSSIRRQIIISCSKIYLFEISGHFTLNGHFWPPNFLCEIDKLLYLRCTHIFLHIFWWTTKYLWYAQVIKKMRKWRICRGAFWNTNIHTEKKAKKYCQNI